MATAKTERDKAIKAARDLLERKADFIGTLGELCFQESEMLSSLERTRTAIADAYDAALAGGWATTELKDMGYQRPRRKNPATLNTTPNDTVAQPHSPVAVTARQPTISAATSDVGDSPATTQEPGD